MIGAYVPYEQYERALYEHLHLGFPELFMAILILIILLVWLVKRR
jgi:hypothetical protein